MASLITEAIAGAYTGTYKEAGGSTNRTIGILNDDGFELAFSPKGQDINDTDQFGMTLIDGVYRGQDWRVRFRGKEWLQAGLQYAASQFNGLAADTPAALNPTSNVAPAADLSIIGRKYTTLAGVLILTSTTGTPAAASPATLTASQALLSPNGNYSQNFTSKVRELPLEMLCIPYTATINASSYVVPFVTA